MIARLSYLNLRPVWLLLLFIAPQEGWGQTPNSQIGRTIAPLESVSVQGETVQLKPSEDAGLTVVVFLGNDCPMAKLYAPRLSEFARRYADRRLRVIGINSNRQDSPASMLKTVAELEIDFPLLKDTGRRLADEFQATRTPEVFLLDRQLVVRYHGRVDDQYQPGIARAEPKRRDLELAIEELLAGKPVTVPETNFFGCLIGRQTEPASVTAVTFTGEVHRVLSDHCLECHRAGDIGPFALADYEDARGWGDMIVEVIDSGFMPPWHANPEHGEFANQRLMPEADKQILRDWVAAGAPRGPDKQLPEVPPATSNWRLPREPDLVVEMGTQPFRIPATGTVDYQYFVVDPGLKEDCWVVGAEVIPGNRSVVHHSIVFVRPPDGEASPGSGWLAAYVPGQRPLPYPTGHGRRIPAGSKFVFQQHYTPNGREQTDTTRIGLLFAPAETIEHEIFTLMAVNQEFEIPPHAENHPVNGKVPFLPPAAKLLSFSPHMHYRGKSFRLVGHKGDQAEVLLDVPRYDFNWQHNYELKSPRPLGDFERIEFEARFDNSAANPANPDPNQTVSWGDQTWEEMAVVFFDATQPRGTGGSARPGRNAATTDEPEYSAAEQAAADAFIDDFFRRFDPRGTGQIPRDQLPQAIRRFVRLDENNDGFVTREELQPLARERFLRQDEQRLRKEDSPR
jgi:peroxiredoxin